MTSITIDAADMRKAAKILSAGIGDNSGNVSADRLRSLIERIERLSAERKGIASDIKDIFTESKSAGFDVAVMKRLIKIRAQEPADVEEQDALLDVYRRALGA